MTPTSRVCAPFPRFRSSSRPPRPLAARGEHDGAAPSDNRKMSALHVVILAAGKGTRMKSRRPKVLHNLAGLPLVEHVLRAVDELQTASTTLVIGPDADAVRSALAGRANLQ